MKLPIPVVCLCGEQFVQEISGSDLPRYAECPKCHGRPYLVWPLGNNVTRLLMERAKQELANGDATIAILLSAMAVEGEMAWLFFHWKKMGIRLSGADFKEVEEEKVNKEWKDMRSIKKSLNELSKLLTGKIFDAFALQNKVLLKSVGGEFDPANTQKILQEQFFNKRNRIIHYGDVDFARQDGEVCFSLASALLGLLNAMHVERVKAMDDALKAASAPVPANNS